MMDKLNIKHKKMVDIQAAVKEGDTNNDGIVDIDEWRHDMRKYVIQDPRYAISIYRSPCVAHVLLNSGATTIRRVVYGWISE